MSINFVDQANVLTTTLRRHRYMCLFHQAIVAGSIVFSSSLEVNKFDCFKSVFRCAMFHNCLLQTVMSPVAVNGVEIGAKVSINFLTNFQKLHRGIWPWTAGLKSRLPLHYKQRYIQKFMRDPAPVHYRPDLRKYVADAVSYTHLTLPTNREV